MAIWGGTTRFPAFERSVSWRNPYQVGVIGPQRTAGGRPTVTWFGSQPQDGPRSSPPAPVAHRGNLTVPVGLRLRRWRTLAVPSPLQHKLLMPSLISRVRATPKRPHSFRAVAINPSRRDATSAAATGVCVRSARASVLAATSCDCAALRWRASAHSRALPRVKRSPTECSARWPGTCFEDVDPLVEVGHARRHPLP